jgi:hypothetical protein
LLQCLKFQSKWMAKPEQYKTLKLGGI